MGFVGSATADAARKSPEAGPACLNRCAPAAAPHSASADTAQSAAASTSPPAYQYSPHRPRAPSSHSSWPLLSAPPQAPPAPLASAIDPPHPRPLPDAPASP